jgi:hypothetical protein
MTFFPLKTHRVCVLNRKLQELHVSRIQTLQIKKTWRSSFFFAIMSVHGLDILSLCQTSKHELHALMKWCFKELLKSSVQSPGLLSRLTQRWLVNKQLLCFIERLGRSFRIYFCQNLGLNYLVTLYELRGRYISLIQTGNIRN